MIKILTFTAIFFLNFIFLIKKTKIILKILFKFTVNHDLRYKLRFKIEILFQCLQCQLKKTRILFFPFHHPKMHTFFRVFSHFAQNEFFVAQKITSFLFPPLDRIILTFYIKLFLLQRAFSKFQITFFKENIFFFSSFYQSLLTV